MTYPTNMAENPGYVRRDEHHAGSNEKNRVNDSTLFQMDLLKGYLLPNSGRSAIEEFRRDLCSMLDWGIFNRKSEIQAVMAAIVEDLEVDQVPVVAQSLYLRGIA